jgi:LemA protein
LEEDAVAEAERAGNGRRETSVKKSALVLLVILGIVVLLGGWAVSSYNSLVKTNETINGQWAQVENQLQRRNDLIPNLVNTVKGYASHEEEVFTAIADARAKLAGAGSVDERAEAAGELQSAISRLLVVVENYPQLKADAQFRALMDELAGTENRLAVERGRFNELVKDFNAKVKQFPMVLFARIAGFSERAYFEVSPDAMTVPDVQF